MTALYSVMHLLVDGVCALAMFGVYCASDKGYFYLLLYNFCAFALQMPFGLLLDFLTAGRREGQPHLASITAGAGVLCTLAGALTHPAVLGIGNALFHVGGGLGTIREDDTKGWRGAGLGVFVAPGALGLFLGAQIARGGNWAAWFPWVGVVMIFLCAAAVLAQRRTGETRIDERIAGEERIEKTRTGERMIDEGRVREREDRKPDGPTGWRNEGKIGLAVCCLAVVILRSYVGMAVAFPWKNGLAAGVLSVLALAGGKAAGGFLAARYSAGKTVGISLSLAAGCYLLSGHIMFGLAALFFFNMTMPVTLYRMVRAFSGLPGFAFGFLTFALFLGFLPGYFGVLPGGSTHWPGCLGALLSLPLLMKCCKFSDSSVGG